MAAFGAKVEATKKELPITVVVDPNVTTIGRTWACFSGSRYSFLIVELKEVVLQNRPRIVDWVPC